MINDDTNEPGLFSPGPKNVQMIYILFLANFVLGFTSVIGVIIAYINRGRTGIPDLETHYQWLITTFWLSLFGLLGLIVLMVILQVTGLMLMAMLAYTGWLIIRLARGLTRFGAEKPIDNPDSWGF